MIDNTRHNVHQEILGAADRMARNLSRRVVDEPAVRATLRRGVGLPAEHPSMLPLHAFVTPYLDALPERSRTAWTSTPDAAVERAFYAVATLIAAQPRQVRDGDAEGEPGPVDSADFEEPEARSAEVVETTRDVPSGDDASPAADPNDHKSAGQGRTRQGFGSVLGSAVGRGDLNVATTEQRLHLLCRQSLDGVHVQLPRVLANAQKKGARIDWGQLVLDLARWGGERDHVAKEWAQGFHRSVERARREGRRAPEKAPDTTEPDLGS